MLARLATLAGRVVRSMRNAPGIVGAAMVSYGAALLGGAAVGLIIGGAFLLLIDREM